jgi:hypothetical protein
MMTVTRITGHALRAWAKGSYPIEAAVELLVRGFDGRFAGPGNPWIQDAGGARPWLNAAAMTDDEMAPLSGGEQRFLRIVRSLAGGEPVRLGDDIPGLDRVRMQLLLAALAHAAGSHEHGGAMQFDEDGRPIGFGDAPGILYPWPAP